MTDKRVDEALLSAARRILDAPSLTENDDLFDAGMTSVFALALADALSDRLGRDISVADVYVGGCLAQIVRAFPPIVDRGSRPGECPVNEPGQLSRAQQRFWIAEQFAPGTADNMLVLGYAIEGPLDPEALRRALADVVERHEALRTIYPVTNDGVTRRVMPADESHVVVEVVDLPSGLDGLEAVAARVTADWWDSPFLLDEQAPLRVRLCRLDDVTHVLSLHTHHIAFDGRSEQIFLEDLSARYEHHLGVTSAAGDAMATPAVDEATTQSRAGSHAAELAFWRRALATPPAPFLPAPPTSSIEGTRSEVFRRVPAEIVGRVRTVTRSRRVPTVAALAAAMARACVGTFRTSDICLGTVADNRSGHGSSTEIGYFVNPVALPLTAVTERDTAELFEHVAAVTLAALQHSSVPFDELVSQMNPERGRHPWFQAWVVLQYPRWVRELSQDTTIRPIRVPAPRTGTELSVEVFPQQDDSWQVELGWRTDGCGEEVVSELADRLVAALAEMAKVHPVP